MPGYVRVTNRRKDMAPDSQPEPHEIVIPVDRRHACLGNPNYLSDKTDRFARQLCLSKYKKLLDDDFAVQGPMYQAIVAIADRVMAGEEICLECNCRPLPCHADLIAEKVNEMVLAQQNELGIGPSY